jgi:hypothetical protein
LNFLVRARSRIGAALQVRNGVGRHEQSEVEEGVRTRGAEFDAFASALKLREVLLWQEFEGEADHLGI